MEGVRRLGAGWRGAVTAGGGGEDWGSTTRQPPPWRYTTQMFALGGMVALEK